MGPHREREKISVPGGVPGADPGFSEGGFGLKLPPTLSNCNCCLTSPFSQKKYDKDICVCITLGVSTEPPEPPLDPAQGTNAQKVLFGIFFGAL